MPLVKVCKFNHFYGCDSKKICNRISIVEDATCIYFNNSSTIESKNLASKNYVNERIQIALQTMASKSYVKDRVNNHNHSPEPPAPMSTTPLTDIINKLEPATWKTSKGTYVRICDMATPHIVNALNMMKKDKNKYKHLAFQSMLTILKSRDYYYDLEECPYSNLRCGRWPNNSRYKCYTNCKYYTEES